MVQAVPIHSILYSRISNQWVTGVQRSIKVDLFHSLSAFSSIQLSQLQLKTGGEMAYRIPAGELRELIVGK